MNKCRDYLLELAGNYVEDSVTKTEYEIMSRLLSKRLPKNHPERTTAPKTLKEPIIDDDELPTEWEKRERDRWAYGDMKGDEERGT